MGPYASVTDRRSDFVRVLPSAATDAHANTPNFEQ